MIFVLGEILFDIFPDGNRLGGAPFNFAFHLKSLGFDVRFVSRVGKDDMGRQILEFLEKNGFDIRDIQQDSEYDTGTVMVNIDTNGSHDFSIVSNTAYDHIEYDKRLQQLSRSDWELFYAGSLIQRTRNNAALIQRILAEKSDTSVSFCDINFRPDNYTDRSVEACLNLADILKLNQEELDILINDRNDDPIGQDLTRPKRVRQLMKAYQIRQIILTRGAKGSEWFGPKIHLTARIHDDAAMIKDTVGAGDAYAAMVVAGQMSGLSPKNIMAFSEEFAGFICSINGAIPRDNSIYQEFKRRLKL